MRPLPALFTLGLTLTLVACSDGGTQADPADVGVDAANSTSEDDPVCNRRECCTPGDDGDAWCAAQFTECSVCQEDGICSHCGDVFEYDLDSGLGDAPDGADLPDRVDIPDGVDLPELDGDLPDFDADTPG